jgi:hypothetical protein
MRGTVMTLTTMRGTVMRGVVTRGTTRKGVVARGNVARRTGKIVIAPIPATINSHILILGPMAMTPMGKITLFHLLFEVIFIEMGNVPGIKSCGI